MSNGLKKFLSMHRHKKYLNKCVPDDAMSNDLTDLNNSIKEIKDRLESIERTVNKIEAMEKAEISYINAVRDMEAEELKGLNKITVMEDHELAKMDKMQPLKYTDIMLWKSAIWESCAHKLMVESKTMVLFNCDISGKVCAFGSCPRNISGEER